MDLLAPFTCRGCGRQGGLLCDRCKKHNIQTILEICPRCGKNHKKCSCEVPIYAVGEREGLLKHLVEEYKFGSIRAMSKILAEFVDASLPEFANAEQVVVVPLPTISRHIRERGFDHTYLLAKNLAKYRKWKVIPLLARKNNTVQVGTNRETRIAQASRAYTINHKKKPNSLISSSDTTYILVDDIWTTGASMEAAIKVLQEAGAQKIIGSVALISK